MDANSRRSRLATAENPEPRLDYIVSLSGSVEASRVVVSYVPDRLILLPDSFGDYLSAADGFRWHYLEATAAVILADLNNELVARWVQIALSRDQEGMLAQRVTIEDRQPKWDNPGLLLRLSPR